MTVRAVIFQHLPFSMPCPCDSKFSLVGRNLQCQHDPWLPVRAADTRSLAFSPPQDFEEGLEPQSTLLMIRQQVRTALSHTISVSWLATTDGTRKSLVPLSCYKFSTSAQVSLFSGQPTWRPSWSKESKASTAKVHLNSIKLSLTSVANRDHLFQHLLSPVILQGFHYDVVGGPSGEAGERGAGGSARNPELQEQAMPRHVTRRSDHSSGVNPLTAKRWCLD